MEANDPDYLVATKIMDANSKTSIFLGNQFSILTVIRFFAILLFVDES